MRKTATLLIIALFFISLVVSFAGQAAGKQKWEKSKTGVGSLMDLSKDRGRMVREYEKETKRYQKIKSAIENNKLEVGETSSNVQRLYGEPVIILNDRIGAFEKWVYKPGEKTFLEGEKAYLVFDGEGKLESWELVFPKTKVSIAD